MNFYLWLDYHFHFYCRSTQRWRWKHISSKRYVLLCKKGHVLETERYLQLARFYKYINSRLLTLQGTKLSFCFNTITLNIPWRWTFTQIFDGTVVLSRCIPHKTLVLKNQWTVQEYKISWKLRRCWNLGHIKLYN